MSKKFYCANCGDLITSEVYMCLDNFLQVKYFENNELNRFCSQRCFCEYCSLDTVDPEDLPEDSFDDALDIQDDDLEY